MKTKPISSGISRQRGFSLMELLVVLLIMGIVSAVLLMQIEAAQQRSQTEAVRLDYFQQARDFVDQFFRDFNQIGYPNGRMIDPSSALWSPALASPLYNDSRLAMGLVKIGHNEIIFEADSKGTGNPESLRYALNGSGSCAFCLQRSEVDKISGDPLTGQSAAVWGTGVNDVVNTSPIFTYFDTTGAKITGLPYDTSTPTGRQKLASVKIVRISLTIRNSSVLDIKTGEPIETSFQSQVAINNCSMAAGGQGMSC